MHCEEQPEIWWCKPITYAQDQENQRLSFCFEALFQRQDEWTNHQIGKYERKFTGRLANECADAKVKHEK